MVYNNYLCVLYIVLVNDLFDFKICNMHETNKQFPEEGSHER